MVPVTENIAAIELFKFISRDFRHVPLTWQLEGWVHKFKNADIVSWIINVVYLATSSLSFCIIADIWNAQR